MAVLAAPMLILWAAFYALDWWQHNHAPADVAVGATHGLRHPTYRALTKNALVELHAMPEDGRNALIEALRVGLLPFNRWLTALDASDIEVLCLGENHSQATRRFLADAFLSRIALDSLMLEATPALMHDIDERIQAGRDYVPLLGADISALLRAATRRNPRLAVWGIDETSAQAQDRERTRIGSRDHAMGINFWARYSPGKRQAVLLGALHCTDQQGWAYARIRMLAPPAVARKMRNIRVIGAHQDGVVEAFVGFLDEIGVDEMSFVIADPASLPVPVKRWFNLFGGAVGAYHTIVVYRERSRPLAAATQAVP